MSIDEPLLMNIVLIAATDILASKGIKLGELLSKANNKLADVVNLVTLFINAYQDKVITKEETKKLIHALNELLNDPWQTLYIYHIRYIYTFSITMVLGDEA